MSVQKKNVIHCFLQDFYVPKANQDIVKYISGQGNNLHSVKTYLGETFLVSMPKKFRRTVWLKKDQLVVIEYISEGNKVKGEIICVVPESCVEELISSKQWPLDSQHCDDLKDFFCSTATKKAQREVPNDQSMFPPSDSEEYELSDEEDNVDSYECTDSS